jgi:hypothetical protein
MQNKNGNRIHIFYSLLENLVMKITDFRTFFLQSSQNSIIIFPIELFVSFVLTEKKLKHNTHFLFVIRELGNENQ